MFASLWCMEKHRARRMTNDERRNKKRTKKSFYSRWRYRESLPVLPYVESCRSDNDDNNKITKACGNIHGIQVCVTISGNVNCVHSTYYGFVYKWHTRVYFGIYRVGHISIPLLWLLSHYLTQAIYALFADSILEKTLYTGLTVNSR